MKIAGSQLNPILATSFRHIFMPQHKNKLELNAEIIAQTKDEDVWNFHLSVQEGLVCLKVLLNSSLNLQNTRTSRLSNHIPHMSFSI